jgi:hypothetical protein
METLESTRLEDVQRILKAVQKEIAMTYQDHPETVLQVKAPSFIRLSRSGASISVETSIRPASSSGLGIGSAPYVVDVKISRAPGVFDMEQLKSNGFYAVVVLAAFAFWLRYKGVDMKDTLTEWALQAAAVVLASTLLFLAYRANGSLTAFPESEIAALRKKLSLRAREALGCERMDIPDEK